MKALINSLAFSPDGLRLWVACGTPRMQLLTLDAATGKPVAPPLDLPGRPVIFRPDGRALVVASPGATNALRVIDRETARPIGPELIDPRHRSSVPAVAFSPDGGSVVMGESNDWEGAVSRAALAWDVKSGKLLFETGKHPGFHIGAIAWSPDGKTVATGGGGGALQFWDATTAAPKGLPRTMPASVIRLAYHPDGRTLAVVIDANGGYGPARVRLLDGRTGLPVGPEWSYEQGILCLSFSPDGDSLAVGLTDGSTEVRDLPRPNTLGQLAHPVVTGYSIAVGTDGRIAVGTGYYSGEVWVSDPASGRSSVLTTAPGKGIRGLAFAPDGKTLAIATGYHYMANKGPRDAEVLIYDTDTRRPICPAIPTGDAIARLYGFSRDGAVLYTIKVGTPARLHLWDARTGKSLGREIEAPPAVTGLAISRDDRLVLFSDRQGRVTRRQLADGAAVGEPWILHPQGINTISASADGRSFVTWASDATVRLWDIETGRPLGPPIENDTNLASVTISPDGRTLVLTTTSGDVRFWDARVGLPLGPPRSYQDAIPAVRFHPAGDRLVLGSWGVFVVPVPAGLTGMRHGRPPMGGGPGRLDPGSERHGGPIEAGGMGPPPPRILGGWRRGGDGAIAGGGRPRSALRQRRRRLS